MSLGKIDNIDIITQACTVLSRIVISEDAQALSLADRCLGDEWHEVVRNSTRKLADEG